MKSTLFLCDYHTVSDLVFILKTIILTIHFLTGDPPSTTTTPTTTTTTPATTTTPTTTPQPTTQAPVCPLEKGYTTLAMSFYSFSNPTDTKATGLKCDKGTSNQCDLSFEICISRLGSR